VGPDWTHIRSTGKEQQRPAYLREGRFQKVITTLDSILFTIQVADSANNEARVIVRGRPGHFWDRGNIYFSVAMPEKFYSGMRVEEDGQKVNGLDTLIAQKGIYTTTLSHTLKLLGASRQLLFQFEGLTEIVIRREGDKSGDHYQLYIPIHSGPLLQEGSFEGTFTIQASGNVDTRTVVIGIDANRKGRVFAGFGGNFRLQNPKNDPQVIDYCLNNLRVAWSRVELPWRFWQPQKTDHPIDSAKNGRLHPAVQKAMEMAARLGQMGIPVILSAWSAPAWAVVGTPKYGPSPDGIWGNPLDTASTKEIYRSIADYIVYLKDQYGVEARFFSFNESDLGINIRQTPQEHAWLIKGLGAYFASRGLETKLLLGDNSDANSYHFIDEALADTSTYPFIGAVSFHSWRGWDKETLQHWADASAKTARPLLVAEGSIDAQAWGYPAIFEEPSYALAEINLYVRLLAICQPLSILQWQLTSDYSPLAGGGIFGNNTPLHATQRFWNLKQLASTPKNLNAINASSNREDVSVAAMIDITETSISIHIVNNNAERRATIRGLPKKIGKLQLYLTNADASFQKGQVVFPKNGEVSITLPATSYISLTSVL
jgi:hypothetical protein